MLRLHVGHRLCRGCCETTSPRQTGVSLQAIRAEVDRLRALVGKLPPSPEGEALRRELERLRGQVEALRGQPLPQPDGPPGPAPPLASSLPEQLVTLDQVGAMVHRSKRSMERYRPRMPPPRVQGRRGQPHLWAWSEIRPWLETAFGVPLPEPFPGLSP